MKILLIEDEDLARKHLSKMLKNLEEDIEIVAELESLEDAMRYFNENSITEIHLIFSDIQLSDGNAFEIFEHFQIQKPIIFTTAYDEFAIRAFKLNSIDYLLKPIQQEDLRNAVEKYQRIIEPINAKSAVDLQEMYKQFQKSKANFIVYYKEKLIPIATDDIAYFFVRNQNVYLATLASKEYVVENTLEEIEKQVLATDFFRANRQFLVARKAILHAEPYFNNRLLIHSASVSFEPIIVSREKVTLFKQWLQGK